MSYHDCLHLLMSRFSTESKILILRQHQYVVEEADVVVFYPYASELREQRKQIVYHKTDVPKATYNESEVIGTNQIDAAFKEVILRMLEKFILTFDVHFGLCSPKRPLPLSASSKEPCHPVEE